MFQSLRGFGVGWSPMRLLAMERRHAVSIPERVWGWLEPTTAEFIARWVYVSIPERVWGWLEL